MTLCVSLNFMISFRSVPIALAVTLGLSIAACGSGSGEASSQKSSPMTAAVDEVRVTCGFEPSGWPISAMDGGIDSRHDRHELKAALEAFVNEPRMMASAVLESSPVEDAPWFVLTESDRSVTLATGQWNANGPVRNAGVLTLNKTGEVWAPAGYQDCGASHLRPALAPDLSWVEVSTSGELDRASAQLEVGLSELACSGGRDPRPFLREPSIVENDDSVTISWTSQASAGGPCSSGSLVSQRVELNKPLGDRVLLDGSHWPARPIAGDA